MEESDQASPRGALLERAAELAALRKALERAGEGVGSVVFVESTAGMGRSRLLAAAAELAATAGGLELRATGRDTERSFPFGVALQLFEERWLTATDEEREELFRGPAETARRLISGPRTAPGEQAPADVFEIIHGLLWALRRMSADGTLRGGRSPLALIVDDVHRADLPSSQFLAYLGARVQALPIVLIVSARRGEPPSDPDGVRALSTGASTVLRPAGLTRESAAAIARAAFPDADPALWETCAEVSGGIPLLLHALVEDVRRRRLELDASATLTVTELVPEPAVDMVTSQLRSLPPAVASIAAALAALSVPSPVSRAAAVAGLSLEEATRAADALGSLGLLRRSTPIAFTNDLLARAVLASIPELELASLRQRADDLSTSPSSDQDVAGTARAVVASAPVVDGVPPVPEERVRLADLAVVSGLRGEHRSRVSRLSELAWSGGTTPSDGSTDTRVAIGVAEALLLVDELELGLDVLADGDRLDPDPDSPANSTVLMAVAACRSSMLYHRGEVAAALGVAEKARVIATATPPGYRLQAIHAACLIQLGQLDSAEAAIPVLEDDQAVPSRDLPVLLEARAQLHLARNRPREALADALKAGQTSGASSASPPGLATWRSSAALAHLALDQPARAQELAEEELDLSRAAGVTRAAIRALRVLGLASTGSARLDALEEAVALGTDTPVRLEYIHALVDLGAATRRANRRAAARNPLTKALELARELGATALANRAEEEITASEARRRHPRATGVEALTPGERRVALLAVQGRTTREIASELYVTPKTVEFHLRHVYRKLGLPSTRADLIAALRDEAEGSVRSDQELGSLTSG